MNTISMELHEEQITELQSQIEELESEKHCLEEEYGDLKSENDELEARKERFKKEIAILKRKCKSYEKALNKACVYIHNNGVDGCPNNYDYLAITNEKIKECYTCGYDCMGLDDQLNSSNLQKEEYLKKSVKCWKEYFLKGEQQNESK